MLKRINSPVLIAVNCAFCCAPAVAERRESEILFRNIPWGSSVSEAQALLKADLGEEITLKKKEPLYFMDRPELGCYSGYNSNELDYYEVPDNTADKFNCQGSELTCTSLNSHSQRVAFSVLLRREVIQRISCRPG